MALYTSNGLRFSTYANGSEGIQGVGISGVTNYYYASSFDDINKIPVESDEAWKPSVQDLPENGKFNEINKYLWNYEKISYTNGTSANTGRIVIAIYSKDGDPGKGIKDVYEYYKLTATNEAPQTKPTLSNDNEWTKYVAGATIPTPTQTYPYLWNYEIIEYTSGDPTTSGPVCIGMGSTSPYTISLDNDFSSVPTDSFGTVSSSWQDTIIPTVYYGYTQESWVNNATEGLGLFASATGVDVAYDTVNKQYVVSNFASNALVGTVNFVLKKDNVKVAEAKYEVVKQRAGADGINSGYLVLASPQSIHINQNNEADVETTYVELAQYGNAINSSFKWYVNVPGISDEAMEIQPYGDNNKIIYVDENNPFRVGISSEVFTRINTQLSALEIAAAEVDSENEPQLTNGYFGVVTIFATRDGANGEDGTNTRYIYYNCAGTETDPPPSATITQYDGGISQSQLKTLGWTDSPTGVSEDKPYEYMSISTKPAGAAGTTSWREFSTPALWSKWGEKGQDGDGVTYIYYRSNSATAPSKPASYEDAKDNDWTDDPQGVTDQQQYEYVVQIKTGAKGTISEPKLWAKWGETGESGEYIYAKTNPTVLHRKDMPEKITVSVYKKIGANTPELYKQSTTLCTIQKDNGNETSLGYISTGTINIPQSYFNNAKTQITINVYTNPTKKTIIDKITIDVLDDGESVYYIYHDKNEGGLPALPTEKDYTKIPLIKSAEYNGWYRNQTSDSVYSSSKIATATTQATVDWNPVIRISGTATTYDDLWNALNDSAKKDASGIYPLGDGYIGINADLIKTGALCVGETPQFKDDVVTDWKNNVLYVDSKNGYFRATKGKIGSMEIGDLVDGIQEKTNPNLLLNSNFAAGKKNWKNIKSRYTTVTKNPDGIYVPWTRDTEIIGNDATDVVDTKDREFVSKGKQILRIRVDHEQPLTEDGNFVWNGVTGLFTPDDCNIKQDEKITVSCKCRVESIVSTDHAKVNRIGFAIKGYNSDGTRDNTGFGHNLSYQEIFNNAPKYTEWFDFSHTFTATKDLYNCELYVYIAAGGEVYFADIKIERGSSKTPWCANSLDKYNNGVNLYTTGTSMGMGGPAASGNNYYKIELPVKASGFPEEQVSYYFSADVEVYDNKKLDSLDVGFATWNTAATTSDKWVGDSHIITNLKITNTYSDGGKFKGIVSGRLYVPRKIQPNPAVNESSLLIKMIVYPGKRGETGGNQITLSNIKIQEGTVSTDYDTFSSDVNGDFSWQFSPTKGITMWNGEQGSGAVTGQNKDDNVVFKIYNTTEGHKLFVRGEVVAEAGSIAGWQLNSVIFQEKEIPVFQSRSSQINGFYYATGLGISNNINDPVFWAGMRTGGGYYNPWAVDSVPGWSLERVLKERTPFYVTGTGEMYATAGEIASWKIKGYTNSNNNTVKMLYNYQQNGNGAINGVGIAFDTTPSDPAIWAGFNSTFSTHPWEHTDKKASNNASSEKWIDCCNFVVRNNGQFKLSYLKNNIGDDEEEGVYFGIDGLGFGRYLKIQPTLGIRFEQTEFDKTPGGRPTTNIYTSSFAHDLWQIQKDMTAGTNNVEIDDTGMHVGFYNGLSGQYAFDEYIEYGRSSIYHSHTSNSMGTIRGMVFDNSTSDRRLKNSIEMLDSVYSAFFDKLNPVRYKYNDGTSKRYHTGFIAQEVVSALENSGLTTQDFAGVMLNNPGTEEECWYLRRDEFVALNTWQIQKLKPRVSKLEETILDYEARISNLETELENLKNS